MGAAEMLPRRRPTRYLRAMILPLGGGAWLRPWRTVDAPALAQAANNRNVWISLRDRMPHPYTLADAEDYIRQRFAADSELIFCIEADGSAVGGIGLHPQEDVCRITAELGYWLAESYWGQGITTEAVRAIVRHGFNTRPLERIEAFVYANNPASARVLEKADVTSKAASDGM